MPTFKNKKVVVLGSGVDTQDIIPWLKKRGDQLTILDEASGDKFENLDKYDLIVRSPGVYLFRDELKKTTTKITSKTKLFFDLCPGKIIGVTGTKGKGTTATLIFEIFKAAGKEAYLGGNIGTGVFEFLPKLTAESWVVLELSSFQLIDLHKSPHIAVVLMTTSEHLNWHQNEGEYVDAKKNIVSHQTKKDFSIVNKDYPNSVNIGGATTGKIIWISGKDIYYQSKLKGEHNQENIAAAVAVAKIVGVPYQEVVANFPGLEHRLEEVATVNGITFYNDSFSTTPETAIAAIKSFTQPEIIILGGSSKNSNFNELAKTIIEAAQVKKVITIGVEGKKIYKLLKSLKFLKVLKGPRNMAEIVKIAYNYATSGDVVLLSPACASFDMFSNYKQRGNQFKEEVLKLK